MCDMRLPPAHHGGGPHGAGPQLVPVPALVDTWRHNAAVPDAARQPADVDPVRALRRAEEQLQALLQNSADFVLVWDAAGTITYFTPSVRRFIGELLDQREPGRALGITHADD